ncbi:unnamed protein product [Cylindrotheca closterium]|uniref:Uncharacterized protein n=1 Tax=Cylindrotheca closterium TaxID=2856 RepID=A0AAD2CL44_9STRA|nr:unnamed protein product [Cylindrotheca closterium]
MATIFQIAVVSSLAVISRQVHAFSVLPAAPSSILRQSSNHHHHPNVNTAHGTMQRQSQLFAEKKNPVDELSEERKENLFQFLLRDMEVEGTPVLACDADQAHTFQGTVWTVMAQLSENDIESKACMVLQEMSIDSLQSFVDDFLAIKANERLMEYLPELARFNVTLLGRGVGPALVVETSNRTTAELEAVAKLESTFSDPNELTWTAAMKAFVARLGGWSEDKDDLPNPHAYRLAGSWDVCDTLATFWVSVCELLAQPEDVLGSTILCLPASKVDSDDSDSVQQARARFAATTELVTESLFMARGQDLFDVSYLHPLYDRDNIHLVDNLYGHLPLLKSVPALLKDSSAYDGNVDALTDNDLKLQNYQRRSPLPAIFVRRQSKKAKEDSTAAVFANLSKEGKEALQEALEKEMELV